MTIRERNRLLEELILRLAREGKTPAEVQQAITLFFEQYGLVDAELLQQKQQQAKTIVRSTAPPSLRSATSGLYQTLLTNVAETKSKTIQDLSYQITQNLSKGLGSKDLLDRVKHTLQISEDRARTVVETSLRGFDRVSNVVAYQNSGVKQFVYDGALSNVRPFCEDLLKKTARGQSWTLEEIETMDNGQGLPVLTHCGGWNCRHRWKPKF